MRFSDAGTLSLKGSAERQKLYGNKHTIFCKAKKSRGEARASMCAGLWSLAVKKVV